MMSAPGWVKGLDRRPDAGARTATANLGVFALPGHGRRAGARCLLGGSTSRSRRSRSTRTSPRTLVELMLSDDYQTLDGRGRAHPGQARRWLSGWATTSRRGHRRRRRRTPSSPRRRRAGPTSRARGSWRTCSSTSPRAATSRAGQGRRREDHRAAQRAERPTTDRWRRRQTAAAPARAADHRPQHRRGGGDEQHARRTLAHPRRPCGHADPLRGRVLPYALLIPAVVVLARARSATRSCGSSSLSLQEFGLAQQFGAPAGVGRARQLHARCSPTRTSGRSSCRSRRLLPGQRRRSRWSSASALALLMHALSRGVRLAVQVGAAARLGDAGRRRDDRVAAGSSTRSTASSTGCSTALGFDYDGPLLAAGPALVLLRRDRDRRVDERAVRRVLRLRRPHPGPRAR